MGNKELWIKDSYGWDRARSDTPPATGEFVWLDRSDPFPELDPDILDVRCCNAMIRYGLWTRALTREYIRTHRGGILSIKNLGRKSADLIERWLNNGARYPLGAYAHEDFDC